MSLTPYFSPPEPLYVNLSRTGELAERARVAREHLEHCDLCPRRGGVHRLRGERGACGCAERAVVSSAFPHFGEEDCLRGWRGSGTVFFAWCNLRCVYCQNGDISWDGDGQEATDEELAQAMLKLQNAGCHNINLVSPSHLVPQVLGALTLAASRGLKVPLVYNSGGYDAYETLRLLDGVIDIYMPDAKYGSSLAGQKYSLVPDYVEVNQAALREMHRQVGDLAIDPQGIARKGVLVRHLVLPNGVSGTDEVLRFLAEELSRTTFVNLMDQYRPCHGAAEFQELDRTLSQPEWNGAVAAARRLGLRLDPGSVS